MTSSKAQVCALPSETNSEIVPIEFTFTKKIQSKNFKIQSLEIGQCFKKNQKKRREIPILLLETYQNQRESDIPVTNNFGLFCLFPVWWIFLCMYMLLLYSVFYFLSSRLASAHWRERAKFTNSQK